MRRTFTSIIVFCIAIAFLSFAATGSASADEITLEVTVVDQDGDPLSNVDVLIDWGEDSASATTLPDGTRSFAVPEGAEFEITVDHAAYVRNFPYTGTATVPAGESRLEVEVPVSLTGSSEITIVEDGEPVEDVRVNFRDIAEAKWIAGQSTDEDAAVYNVQRSASTTQNFRTNEDGTITVTRLEQREYQVHTRKSGYLDTSTTVTVDSDTVNDTIEVEQSRVRVDFLVEDDHFSPPRPIEDVAIEIPQRGIRLSTFSDGTQEQQLPVNTNYDIEVSKDGYDGVSEKLEVDEENKEFEISIQRTPTLNLNLLNNQVVVGQSAQLTVLDAYNEAIEGASVSLNEEPVGETDITGQLSIPIEEEGEQTVLVEYEGLEETITIESFDPTDDDIPEDIADDVDVDQESDDEADGEDDADDDGAGFGVMLAVGALLCALAIVVRRR